MIGIDTQNIRTIRASVEAFRVFFESRDGRPSSSRRYPSRLVYFYLRMYKNFVQYQDKLIRAKTESDLNVEEVISCVELQKVDRVENCPCAPRSGCSWLKSVHQIPRLLSGMPTSVTLLHKNSRQKDYGNFTYVDWFNFEDKINGRYQAQATQPYYTMRTIDSKRHLYIYVNSDYKNLGAVTVSGVFQDSLEVANFPVCGAEPAPVCSPLDQELIIPQEIQSKVFELTYNALVGLSNVSPTGDVLNNNNNDTANRV